MVELTRQTQKAEKPYGQNVSPTKGGFSKVPFSAQWKQLFLQESYVEQLHTDFLYLATFIPWPIRETLAILKHKPLLLTLH